ncbi:MAG: hypothetical protein ACRDZY_12970 [Acidimicrobiales bacterium]
MSQSSSAHRAMVEDPEGRSVRLTEERWSHIVAGHPELQDHEQAILRAVVAPSRTMPGRRTGEEWCYLEGAGPSRWLKVVVAYEDMSGAIITAFARRSIP